MSQQVEIAKTIAAQIGNRRMFALGAANKVALAETVEKQGGLQFKASLFGKQQCRVVVELTYMDTYNVKILKPRADDVIAQMKDVHCEELGDLIEWNVEKHFAKR